MGEMRSTKGEFIFDDSVIFCEICGLPIGNNEEFVLCPDCATPFHKNCWNIRGGCGNHECKSYVEKKAGSDNTVNRVVFAINEKAKKSLENGEFENALALYKKALSYDGANDEALIGMLLADACVTSLETLFLLNVEFERFPMYQTIQNRFSHKTKSLLENEIALRKERKRLEKEKQEKIEQERQEKERLEKENKDSKTDTPSQKPKANTRKIVLISVILAILLSVIIGVAALWIGLAGMTDEPSDYEENDTFKYVVSYNSITIVGIVDQEVESLVIPSKINGISVTSIGNSAFYNCDSLKSVVIGNNVTEIGELAFSDCDSLESVTGLGGVKTIGDSAFSNCISLTNITIPSSVTTIGDFAFSNCISLASFTIPNSVTTIGDWAFFGCTSLTIYAQAESQPSGWVSGWNHSNCPVVWDYKEQNASNSDLSWEVTGNNEITIVGVASGATNIVIPIEIEGKTVAAIGDYAFSGCDSLESVTIPNSVTKIGKFAFYNCTSLESVEIPTGVTSIGDNAFDSCVSLASVTIPNSVTSIGWYAFFDCTGLKNVIIGNSVITIGDWAFNGCTSLESVVIPNSVTSIGNWAFKECDSLASVTVGNSVTSIGYEAFCDCDRLESINIPSSVTSIGSYAFRYCTSLTIYCESELQPSGWDSDWNYSNRPVEWGAK